MQGSGAELTGRGFWALRGLRVLGCLGFRVVDCFRVWGQDYDLERACPESHTPEESATLRRTPLKPKAE